MAATPRSKTIKIRQGLDERYLRGILTRDISPVEAVLDLIDNSIDAARNDLLAKGKADKDRLGLPASYAGYGVSVRITKKGVVISDNCHGFDRSTLQKEAFIIGRRSKHPQGIGYFGVGLKRALMALGSNYALKTNRPTFAASMRLTAKDISSHDKPVIATLIPPRPSVRATIAISRLQAGAAHEFGGDQDLTDLRNALSRRYGLFIRKGLHLVLNGGKISPFVPTIRQRGPIRPKRWHGRIGRVDVFIEAGMHARYRGRTEKDYDREINNGLTDEYGWYIVCNDRTIEVASKEKRLGFSTYWHTEYYGFLGWVQFIAADPEDLPWNTTKTEIDTRTPLFRETLEKLEEFSDEFRKENRTARKKALAPKTGKATKKKVSKTSSAPVSSPAKTHVNQWEELLPDIPFNWNDAKLSSLLTEAEDLQVDFSYSGVALLRMIVERALDQHIRRSRRLGDVKQSVAEAQAAAGRPFTSAQLDNYEPTLGTYLDWLKKNGEYFPEDVRSECSHGVSKFSIALSKTINGAMHKNIILERTQLVAIRNEAYPLIHFLLTVPPKASH